MNRTDAIHTIGVVVLTTSAGLVWLGVLTGSGAEVLAGLILALISLIAIGAAD